MNPSPQDVLHHFISSRREWDQDRHLGTPGYLRASEFGPCEREQHFKRLGIERTRDFDEKTLLTFEWGNLLEAVVREAYRACGLLVASQVPLKDDELKTTATTDLVIGGEIRTFSPLDARYVRTLTRVLEQDISAEGVESWLAALRESFITKYGPVMPYRVLEVKSQKDSAMMWLHKEGPHENNKFQVGVQQLLAERNPDQMPVPVQSFGIVYVGKGNWGILDWDAEPSWKALAFSRINRMNLAQLFDDLPPCTCASVWGGKYRWNPNTKQSYCAYFQDGLCCSEDLLDRVEVSA